MAKVLLALLAVLLGFYIWTNVVSRPGSKALLNCGKVKIGMTRAEALALMDTPHDSVKADDGDRLIFEAPMAADTVPQVYVDPKTDKVVRTECP